MPPRKGKKKQAVLSFSEQFAQALRNGSLDAALKASGWRKDEEQVKLQQQRSAKQEAEKKEKLLKEEQKKVEKAKEKTEVLPGWRLSKSKAPSASAAPPVPAKKTVKLLPLGWSAAVKTSASELQVGVPAVCLASTAEAKQAMKELKSSGSLAVLAPNSVNGEGERVSVHVEFEDGKKDQITRFLIQLGSGAPVTYTPVGQKGGVVDKNHARVVLTADKAKVSDWKSLIAVSYTHLTLPTKRIV